MSNVKFRFTQQAVYCLASINTLIRRETGKVYRMSENEDIIEILKLAQQSENPEVHEKLTVMIKSINEFSPETARYIVDLGIPQVDMRRQRRRA